MTELDGDQKPEIVGVGFGAMAGIAVPVGEVNVYTRTGGLGSWSAAPVVSSAAGLNFPNSPTLSDVDGDGDLDAILPLGFLVCTAIPGGGPCGGLLWYEQDSGAWHPHTVVAKGAQLFYHHAEHVDFDGDGVKDLVTVGEAAGVFGAPGRAETQWFKGTGTADRFESAPRKIGDGGGSVPTVTDLDGDGDLDVVSAQYFVKDASFVWFERVAEPSSGAPAGTFVKHAIDTQSGVSILFQLVPDLYGDGVLRAIGANHTNTAKTPPDTATEGVFVFDLPADRAQPWARTPISFGIRSRPGSAFAPQGAPGVFDVGDVDGDGDLDVAVSGDGDPRVFWLEQSPNGWFTHVVAEGVGQAGGLRIVDLDGNGTAELVVPVYEANAIYVYEHP